MAATMAMPISRFTYRRKTMVLSVRVFALISGLTLSSAAMAADEMWGRRLLSEDALLRTVQRDGTELPERLTTPVTPTRADYMLPAIEIAAFQFLLNRFDNRFIGPEYDVSLSSIRRNLRSSWVEDRDPFAINQLGHPYQGATYYGIARSNGLNFWESFAYTFAGSAVWEIAGETTPPSRNDQITTSFAGAFLGESLYRMANLILERGNVLSSGWREVAAAAVSPPTGFNRLSFPERFAAAFASNNPATFGRLQLGANGTTEISPGTSTVVRKRNEAIVDYAFDYGLPGKVGYQYHRPFDYFNFQIRASSAHGVESVHNRGLIIGESYQNVSNTYRGIWGLYGSFDYLAPQLFRLSSTALSLGSTAQWRMSDTISLQGTATAGAGFTSTGTIQGASDREYNFGVAPQALLALRIIFGDAAVLETNVRQYFAGRLAQSQTGGKDRVLRADASLMFRIHRNHGIAIKYLSSRRNSSFADLGDRSQRRDTLGIYYTYLHGKRFGIVD